MHYILALRGDQPTQRHFHTILVLYWQDSSLADWDSSCNLNCTLICFAGPVGCHSPCFVCPPWWVLLFQRTWACQKTHPSTGWLALCWRDVGCREYSIVFRLVWHLKKPVKSHLSASVIFRNLCSIRWKRAKKERILDFSPYVGIWYISTWALMYSKCSWRYDIYYKSYMYDIF